MMKLFTVDEANRTLPLVRRIVEDIVRSHRAWREKILELDLIVSTPRADGADDEATRIEREAQGIAREIESFERELVDLGIQIKDRRLGLIDFPSRIEGRDVFLCWRLGEPDVGYWHEANTGYRGRRPLEPTVAADAAAGPLPL